MDTQAKFVALNTDDDVIHGADTQSVLMNDLKAFFANELGNDESEVFYLYKLVGTYRAETSTTITKLED